MANLGDFFPDKLKENAVKNSIKAGSVLKLYSKDTKPKPKEKRFIVIGKDIHNNLIGVVYINSNINFNVINSQTLINLQYDIEKKDNDFLDWDSTIDCSKIVTLPYKNVKAEIVSDTSRILGELKNSDLVDIIQLIRTSPNVSPIELRRIGL
jgi:hypothetical protein